MAEAKKCDRCRVLYEQPSRDEMPYDVKKKDMNCCLDLCPDCKYDLEDWMTSEKLFPKRNNRKRKRSHEWSDETREKHSEAMSIRQQLAKNLKKKNLDLDSKEAFSKACKLVKDKGIEHFRKKIKKIPRRLQTTKKSSLIKVRSTKECTDALCAGKVRSTNRIKCVRTAKSIFPTIKNLWHNHDSTNAREPSW